MPANKNQHFVPRCALKPFTLNSAGLAINLFNIARARTVENAPVRSQCARPYFYGKGAASVEDRLANLEGQYARIVSLLANDSALSSPDEEWLRVFIAIQQRRTEAAINEMRALTESMADKVFSRSPEQRPAAETHEQLMQMSLRLALELKKYADDLKLVVLANETGRDFVTCDHPAVLTNRYHFQRLNAANFGMSNSGAIISMPLSPRLSLLAYDTNVYTVPNATGEPFVSVTKSADVHALNQFQYLSASQNVYFQALGDAERIGSEIGELADIRTGAGPTSEVLVRDPEADGIGEAYRRGSAEEEATARESIIVSGFRRPAPPNWPSVLKYRSKPRTFYNGTAVGHVRREEWLEPHRSGS
jgi:predicted nucleic acid-binding protein